MKTTIELPDKLFKQAKLESVKKGISLKELFISALENELNISSSNNTEFPWKELMNSGSSNDLFASESGFEGYQEPDWMNAVQVNDSSPKFKS